MNIRLALLICGCAAAALAGPAKAANQTAAKRTPVALYATTVRPKRHSGRAFGTPSAWETGSSFPNQASAAWGSLVAAGKSRVN